ncbi:hypothetical protein CTRI78_v003687 [Colletotrichum trifolii]|uniref:Spindle pole body component n=1 Tax=Colletotrichum trifolii TaxID=5466 RepID=A0A4V3HWN8_COLTR|nr:hypothetical protein CTRI78_v003687 [Colletotrichum trifolii]
MTVDKESANVFAIPDFGEAHQWELPQSDTGFFAFNPDGQLPEGSFLSSTEPPNKPSELFALPVIDVPEEEETDSGAEVPEPQEQGPPADDRIDIGDVWAAVDKPAREDPTFKTWVNFESPAVPSTKPLFITEASPGAFDALIQRDGDPLRLGSADFSVVETGTYCNALLSLALGRESVFFSWEEGAKSFKPILSRMRIPAYSGKAIQEVQQSCLKCGNTYRRLRSIRRADLDEDVFVIVYKQAQSAEYAEVHLRDMMREVLRRVSRPWIELVEEWIGTRHEAGVPLGKHEVGRQKGFIKVTSEMYIDDFGDEIEEVDYRLDTSRIPSFVPDDIVKSLFEVGRNLRFIRSTHSDHALAQGRVISASQPPTLKWLFDWESIVQLEERVRSYEDALREAVDTYASRESAQLEIPGWGQAGPAPYQLQFFGLEEGQLINRLEASMQDFAQPIEDSTSDDALGIIIRGRLSDVRTEVGNAGTDFTPHWSLLPVLSFGAVISAQSRVVGRESLKLLFTSHDLRMHLDLQKQFQLLGNGFFCSRLSHALFDPDLETAERQAGVARQGGVMGLRLSGRDTWPPASSELRLALMGVLTESYDSPAKDNCSEVKELPGDLSFGVRSLSDEEIDKCMDADGLEALDFLRLSYKPPPALSSIITPIILVQYDRIFKLLLRVLRMQYTVNRLFRDVSAREAGWIGSEDVTVRFCFEARHFITSLSSYMFDTGIEVPWQAFNSLLEEVELDLRSADGGADSGPVLSPDRLREHHSQVLDRMMLALLLRKRQQPVLKLLEDIFRVILGFAKYARLKADGRKVRVRNDTAAQSLYKNFRRNVEVFVTVCRGLSEKGEYGSKKDNADDKGGSARVDALEDNPVVHLLLRLDMFGFYTKA